MSSQSAHSGDGRREPAGAREDLNALAHAAEPGEEVGGLVLVSQRYDITRSRLVPVLHAELAAVGQEVGPMLALASAAANAVVKTYTRLHKEAIDVTEGRTDMAAAVARLVQLIPPARIDLVDEVLVRVGSRDLNLTPTGPGAPDSPARLPYQGGAPWRGEDAGAERRGRCDPLPRQDAADPPGVPAQAAWRVRRRVQDPDELGKVVDVAELVEDDQGQPATGPRMPRAS
jgi:hypothetical protein